MDTDYSQAADHPAALTIAFRDVYGDRLEKRSRSRTEIGAVTMGIESAARNLRSYETANSVTFLALHDGDLSRVQQAYRDAGTDSLNRVSALVDLREIVRDLLGLGD